MWIEVINTTQSGYYIKYSIQQILYNFYLTNFISIWEVSIEENKLENLLLENNPLLGADGSSLVNNCIELIFNGISKNNVKSNFKLISDNTNNETQIELQLIVSNDNFIIKLPLLFVPSNYNVFCKEVTVPMIMKLNELQKSEDILIDLLNKKDKEISEYKAEGAVLPLKHLETKKFCMNNHKMDHKFANDNLSLIKTSSVISSLHKSLGISEDFDHVCKTEKSSSRILKNKQNRKIDPALLPNKPATEVKVEIKTEPGLPNIEDSKQNILDIKINTSIQTKKKTTNKRKLNF
ncbi:uncharacterized protein LOC143917596 isoform X2 [Arctopsyche grandis]|uniref:uncharacterized protein LOC143917596 isoform X2 n=1 Tax=Arctopsyche grandis TaxID=121162 RepID=UPI00406D8DC0